MQQTTDAPPSRAAAAGGPEDETTDLFERVETTDAAAEETTDAADDTEYGLGGEDPASRRVFFIGIGGPSCSGKTTLANRLAKALNSPLNPVPCDGYFVPSRMPRHPQYGINWETPEGIDFETLQQDMDHIEKALSCTEAVPSSLVIKAHPSRGGGDMVRSGMANRKLDPGAPVVVLIEGFLLFYDTSISQMFDCTLWLPGDLDTCCGRRHRRDAAGMAATDFQSWYAGLVWAHFEKYQDRQLANADAPLRLDFRKPPDTLQEEAAAYCRARLSLR
jgi:nicotinamide/nicotinate riboside kinase